MKKNTISKDLFKSSKLFLVSISTFFTLSAFAQFTSGNLVVLQVGNGVSTLTSTGNPLILNEYNSLGTLTYSVAIPSTGITALVLRGSATSEGYISRSADNNYVVFGAYLQALPNTTVLNTVAASTISRAVGLVDANGNYVMAASCAISSLASGDIRGAAASNGSNVWATSSSQGTSYYGTAATPTNVENTKTNLRAANIFNNQLYISSQVSSGTPTDIGVYTVGSGTPNISAQTVVTAINTGTASQPGQFFFNSASNICYVADARNSAGGGIQKWVLSSGTWSLAYTLPTGTAAIGAFGVVADFSGSNPKVYATTTETSANRLVAILDIGSNSTATTIATASLTNSIFRGLAWSPVSSTCVPVSVLTTSNNAPVCSSQNLSLNVNAAGTAPITYTWLGTGAINSSSIANPIITNAATGIYTVLLSNACGTASAGVTVTISPTPTIQVNAASICAGGIATITANGANTYTWNNNSTNPSFTASPSSNTSYTINGTSLAGCAANSVTTSITVVTSVSISVNSPSICAGKSATLNAQGASTYTWTSPSASTGVIIVSPTTTTNYTVSGNASGCPNTVSTIATVVVYALPTVIITNTKKLFCKSDASITLVGSPSGGNFSGIPISGNVFSTNTIGTFSISYTYTNSNNCSNSVVDSYTVNACTDLPDFSVTTQAIIYPNPASNEIYIQQANSQPSKIKVFDIYGKLVISTTSNADLTRIQIDGLKAGLYFIQIEGLNNKQYRFIKN